MCFRRKILIRLFSCFNSDASSVRPTKAFFLCLLHLLTELLDCVLSGVRRVPISFWLPSEKLFDFFSRISPANARTDQKVPFWPIPTAPASSARFWRSLRRSASNWLIRAACASSALAFTRSSSRSALRSSSKTGGWLLAVRLRAPQSWLWTPIQPWLRKALPSTHSNPRSVPDCDALKSSFPAKKPRSFQQSELIRAKSSAWLSLR